MVGLGISEMIFDIKLKILQGLNCSWDEAFVGLKNHQVWVAIYESDCPALMQKEIVADWAKSELRFQGLAKFPKASLECD